MPDIRPAGPGDRDAIADILLPVFGAGETYAVDPGLDAPGALDYWFGGGRRVFVAERSGTILGTYYIRPNQPGGGAHVCNCGYVTAARATGRGVARAMLDHSIARARTEGYRAMQFNFVIASNLRAIETWQRNGFDIVGRLPGAYRHPSLGYVDALVMFRDLTEA